MAERKEAKAEKDEAEKYQKLVKEFVSFSWCFVSSRTCSVSYLFVRDLKRTLM